MKTSQGGNGAPENSRYLDISEFRKLGLLQEINRIMLHPMGLALEVRRNSDGKEYISGVQDQRTNPAGYLYADGVLDDDSYLKSQLVKAMYRRFMKARRRLFGWQVQPVKKGGDRG